MSANRARDVTPRTIRFPTRLRARIADDAERCGRSFEAQVVAVLRHHYGEDVDIAPTPDFVIQLAQGSVSGISRQDQKALEQRLTEDD